MRRDLRTKLYDGVAGIAGDRPSPGASARGRYAAGCLQDITLSGGWPTALLWASCLLGILDKVA